MLARPSVEQTCMKSPVSMYDALITAHVPADKARDVADALESDMTTALASKQDVESLGLLLRREIELLRGEFAALRGEMNALRRESLCAGFRRDLEVALARQTIRLLLAFGGMLGVGLGLLFAALQLVD